MAKRLLADYFIAQEAIVVPNETPLENAIYVKPIMKDEEIGFNIHTGVSGTKPLSLEASTNEDLLKNGSGKYFTEEEEVLAEKQFDAPDDSEPLPIESDPNYRFGFSDVTPDNESLNSGFELDDELGEDDSSNDIDDLADLRHEDNYDVSLEHRVNDLLYLLKDIEQSRGMKRSFAMEAEKLLPGFGGGVPAGYYTEAVSATRYKVAVEEISKGIWALIGAVIAASIAAIVKIYSYFSRKDKGEEGDRSSAVEGIDVKIKVAANDVSALDETASIVQDAGRLLAHANIVLKNDNGHEYRCDSFQAIINHIFTDQERFGRAKKFLNSGDPVMNDIIHNGKYSQVAAEASSKLSLVSAAIIAKMDLIDQAIRNDLGSSSISSEMKSSHMLNQAGKPIDLVIHNRTMSMSETANYLRSVRAELVHDHANNPITFDKLFTTMASAYRARSIEHLLKQLRDAVEASATMQQRLEKMQHMTRNLAMDGTPGAATQGVGEHLRQVVFSCAKDVVGLGALASEVSYYATVLEHLAKETLGFGIEVVRKTTAEMRRNKQEIPEGWQKVVDDLKQQQKIVTQAYYRL